MHNIFIAIESCPGIPSCMTVAEIGVTAMEDEHFNALAELIFHGWTSMKAEVQKEMQAYWLFRDTITITGGIAIKGRGIIMPPSLQQKALK